MIRRAGVLLLVIVCAWGCTAAAQPAAQRAIVVFAAASLTDAPPGALHRRTYSRWPATGWPW